MLHRKSIIAFWRYCSVETFQLLVINEINSSFWNGQSIFHLEILLKSFQNYQPFFFIFSKGHWPFTRQSMSVNPPLLLLCFKDKEIWSLYFFLFKSHISLFLAKYIFLCSWCHTQMQPSNGHQADRSFFSFSISNGSQVWVMNSIKISLILVRLVQLFSITFFI